MVRFYNFCFLTKYWKQLINKSYDSNPPSQSPRRVKDNQSYHFCKRYSHSGNYRKISTNNESSSSKSPTGSPRGDNSDKTYYSQKRYSDSGHNYDQTASEDIKKKIWDGIVTSKVFDYKSSKFVESKIEEVCQKGEKGEYKACTVDKSPLRNKYFFGEGYIYGNQLTKKGPGNEKLYPRGEVDPIPEWIYDLVVDPIVEAGMIPSRNFVNSAVINVYLPGGCIVSHIDPPQIFDRPIITASFMSNSSLSFGVKFSFRPMRTSKPIVKVPVNRGTVLSMSGFSANGITHCICPNDVTARRAVIILRHVPDNAPRLSVMELNELRRSGILPYEKSTCIDSSTSQNYKEDKKNIELSPCAREVSVSSLDSDDSITKRIVIKKDELLSIKKKKLKNSSESSQQREKRLRKQLKARLKRNKLIRLQKKQKKLEKKIYS